MAPPIDAPPASFQVVEEKSPFDGWQAWRSHAGAIIGIVISLPSLITFGVYLNDLETAHRGVIERQELARLRGIAVALAFVLGPLYSVSASALGLRRTYALGALLMQLGVLGTSSARATWQLALAAVAEGVGVGGLFFVCLALPGAWFRRKFDFASASSQTAAGVGFALWPLARSQGIARLGWQMSLRAEVVVCSVALLVAVVFLVRDAPVVVADEKPAKKSWQHLILDALDLSLFVDWRFYLALLQIGCQVAQTIVLLAVPPYFADSVDGAALLSAFGIASISSRFLLSALQSTAFGSRIPKLIFIGSGMITVVVSIQLLQLFTDTAALFGVILLAGFGDGLYVSPQPALLAELFGVERLAPALSYWTMSQGVLTLCAYEVVARVVQLSGAWRNAFAVGTGTYAVAFGAAALLFLGDTWQTRRRRREVVDSRKKVTTVSAAVGDSTTTIATLVE